MTSDKNYLNRSQTRLVRIDKKKKQPLGLTLEKDEFNQFRVARIIAGGAIDKNYRAAIKEGDIILEINKKNFDSVDDFQDIVANQSIIQIKIGSVIDDKMEKLTTEIHEMNLNKNNDKKFVCYMRALYNYDPNEDSLLPCKDIGLPFSIGDILQIVDKSDPNWWQAKKLNEDERAGLIPSQELEERRKAFVDPEADYVHSIGLCGTRVARKKKKIPYTSKFSDLYDKAELLCYEEVARMPPFRRKTLVLIGPQGVGKRTLKQRIINSDSNKFGSAIPHTSRPQRALEDNGVNYWFVDQDTIEADIREHKFLEYGQLNDYIYGTRLDTIRDIFKQGKMCVLDCSPSALKVLHNSSEFLPYVIFIAAPNIRQLANFYDNGRSHTGTYSSRTINQFERQSSIRYSSRRARTLESLASLYEEEDLQKTIEESACLQRTYEKYIDFVIVNEDLDSTFTKIMEHLETLQTSNQWVPVNWIY